VPGSVNYSTTAYQIPAGSQRIGALVNYSGDDTLLIVSARNIYTNIADTWATLQGPTSNPVFSAGTATSLYSWSEWKDHLFITNDAGTRVQKLYKDNGGTLRVRTAGLPAMATTDNYVAATETTNAVTLANELRTDMLAHFADVSIYHQTADTAAAALVTAPAATNLTTLLALTNVLVAAYELHYRDSIKGAPTYHYVDPQGSTHNPIVYPIDPKLVSTATATTLLEAVDRLNDLRKCFNHHDGDIDTHGSAPVGTYQITSALVGPLTSGPAFSNSLAPLYDLANALKAQFNNHVFAFTSVAYLNGDVTNGSDTITNITPNTTNVSAGMFVRQWSGDTTLVFGDAPTGAVISKTATTIKLSSTATATVSGISFFVGNATDIHPYDSSSLAVATADATTPDTLRNLLFALRKAYTEHGVSFLSYHNNTLDYDNALADLDFLISTGFTPDTYGGYNSDQLVGMLAAMAELQTKYNAHVVDNDIHYPFTSDVRQKRPYYTVGIPTPTFANYNYAFVYDYSYMVGQLTFEDVGPRLVTQATQVVSIDVLPLAISNIPVLANGSSDNWDTSAITVKIYRTTDGGSTYYYVGQVTNGTTTFTDRVTDSELIDNETIYTDGGLPDNDPPPLCKYLHVTGDVGYFAHITEGSEVFGARVVQSIPGDPDSVPGDFYDEMDEDITGISSVRTRPVCFTTKSVYRLDGQYGVDGAGAVSHEKIADTVGCVSHTSIVQIEGGLVFAGTDGFYFTDGYQVQKISDEFNTTYARLVATPTRAARIVGTYDRLTQRVWWAVQNDNGSTDNDTCFILHLRYGIKRDSCFTTASSGTDWAPSALVFFAGQLIRADRRGYLFKHDATYTTHPKIDTGAAASTWATKAIIHDWESIGINMGLEGVRKLANRVHVRAENESNLTLAISTDVDSGKAVKSFRHPIRFRGNDTWGDPLDSWGDPDALWNYGGLIDESRKFPAGSLRFNNRQIRVTNAYTAIWNSDSTCQSTVDATAKTLTLDDPVTFDWPTNAVGYFVAFEADGYVQEFEVTGRAANVLTLSDAGNDLVDGSTEWVLRGYPKDEVLHLLSITMWATPMTTEQKGYQASQEGENT
jgi:hypothetical protein